MPVLHHSDLLIDADAVLRGQGADPAIIRERKPMLVRVAEEAIREAGPLMRPEVTYVRLDVVGRQPDRVELAGRNAFSGEQVARLLAQAEHVIAAVCTIGRDLEDYSARILEDDLVRGLALEGVGAAATEALSNWACRHFEDEAEAAGMLTTTPLNPGMLGWPIEVGQPEIFAALDGPELTVSLNEQAIMIPRMSLSLVLGIGRKVRAEGIVCDYCPVQEHCRYRIKAKEPSRPDGA